MRPDESDEPFSFREIQDAASTSPAPPPEPKIVLATDGVKLAVRVYEPPSPTKAVLVFYHGGGEHSGAGYQFLGQGLCDHYGIAVYTPDLRGHGQSGGPRGDAPSAEQVLCDIGTVLEYAKRPNVPLFLGGHSSGGGLVVNYATWPNRLESIDGYGLLSPQLGYKSDTARPTKTEFAVASMWPFLVNGMFGFLGHYKAVRFNYQQRVLEQDKDIVSWNTVNVAKAVTPHDPQGQISGIVNLVGMWIGGDDELLVAEKVVAFIKEPAIGKVVPGETHLGILVNAHLLLGPWISEVCA